MSEELEELTDFMAEARNTMRIMDIITLYLVFIAGLFVYAIYL